MDVFIAGFFLTLFFIINSFYSNNIYLSLLVSSILGVSTDIGDFSAVLLFFTILYGLIFRVLYFSKRYFIYFIFFAVVMSFLIFLSLINGGYLYNAIGKSLRIFIILCLFFISYERNTFSFYEISKCIRSFYIVTFVSIPVFYFMGYYTDVGMFGVRVSGFFYDSNYLALFCFIFIVYLSYFGRILNSIRNRDVFFLVCLLILCQSWSIFLFLFFYILVSYKQLEYIGRNLSPYFPIIIISIIWILLDEMDKFVLLDDWQSSYLSLKLNSLMFRLNASLDGLLVIKDNLSVFFFGMGSGRTLEITNKVFHNLYLQQLFDHGVFYYLIFSFLLWFLFKYKFKKITILHIMVIFMYLNNVFFDNFYSFIFSFVIFIFSSTYKNISIVSIHKDLGK